jgi:hypothetical protein
MPVADDEGDVVRLDIRDGAAGEAVLDGVLVRNRVRAIDPAASTLEAGGPSRRRTLSAVAPYAIPSAPSRPDCGVAAPPRW